MSRNTIRERSRKGKWKQWTPAQAGSSQQSDDLNRRAGDYAHAHHHLRGTNLHDPVFVAVKDKYGLICLADVETSWPSQTLNFASVACFGDRPSNLDKTLISAPVSGGAILLGDQSTAKSQIGGALRQIQRGNWGTNLPEVSWSGRTMLVNFAQYSRTLRDQNGGERGSRS